jgi:hypothetical protein
MERTSQYRLDKSGWIAPFVFAWTTEAAPAFAGGADFHMKTFVRRSTKWTMENYVPPGDIAPGGLVWDAPRIEEVLPGEHFLNRKYWFFVGSFGICFIILIKRLFKPMISTIQD